MVYTSCYYPQHCQRVQCLLPTRKLQSSPRARRTAYVCVCNFFVFVLSCICKGLATGGSPIQGVLLNVYKKKRYRTPQTGSPWAALACSAIHTAKADTCTRGPVRPTCSSLDTTHAHRRLSYCSFHGDIDFIPNSVRSL
jgi:hypothetical protein